MASPLPYIFKPSFKMFILAFISLSYIIYILNFKRHFSKSDFEIEVFVCSIGEANPNTIKQYILTQV